MNITRPNRAWVSIKEAAGYLSVSTSTIRRLRQALDPFTRKPFLVSCQPTPRLILISAASLEAHRKAAEDLEFWDRRELTRSTARTGGRRARCPAIPKGQRRGRRNRH